MANQFSESYKSRLLAKTLGLKWYEGEPCKNCGNIIKSTNHCGCKICHTERNKHKLYDSNLMAPYRTKAKANAKTYRYRARKKKQLPYDADRNLIESFYLKAEQLTIETGIPHEVDHIQPLSKGGMHHQNNLQILTRFENRSKGDKLC